jgi:hypothetical protein
MGYTKLFSTLITSTIWSEDDRTRLVWVTMLALADKNGEVHATIPGLARMACVDISAVEIALIKFLSPDLYSRSKESDGRRIEEIDGGWFLLNHQKYREMLAAQDNAERQARWRERQKRLVTESNADVTRGSNEITNLTYSEAEAEAKVKVTASAVPPPPPPPPPEKWLGDLRSRYAGIDIEQEFTKASRHAAEHKKPFTKTFFTRWLDRIGEPITETLKDNPSPVFDPTWQPSDDAWKRRLDLLPPTPRRDVLEEMQTSGNLDWVNLQNYEKRVLIEAIPEYQAKASRAP